MPEGGETIPLNLPSSERVRAVYLLDNNIIKQHPDNLDLHILLLLNVNKCIVMKG